MNEAIAVEASFEDDGSVRPTAFFWQGRRHVITSLGRRWEHAGALHMLVMVSAGSAYELACLPEESGWRLLRIPEDFGDRHRMT